MRQVLTDTSVWVDLLRGTGGSTRPHLDEHLRQGRDHGLRMCEPVAMELVGGAGPTEILRVHRLVDSLPTIEVDPRLDFRAAGELYRTARAGGHTVRSFVDCLIAAIAIRTDSTVVHRDHDFEVLAEVSSLTQERWG